MSRQCITTMMKFLLQDKSFYEEFADGVKIFFHSKLQINLSESLFTTLELISWVGILLVIDYILRAAIFPVLRKGVKITQSEWGEALYRHKVFMAALHLIPLGFASNMNPILFLKDPSLFYLVNKATQLLYIIVFTQLVFRLVNTTLSMYSQENSYTTVGIRTFGQMLKFIIAFFALLSGIMVLFTVNTNTIITVLGALTAAVLLIFRDAIFGFVSGLQISYSRIVKIGDWITISKGDIEGIVREININLVKIEKFDKTIATVPTVDLVSSQVTNHMAMLATGTRQIKRGISFNVNSFRFCDEELLNRFENILLIKDYIHQKRIEIGQYNESISLGEIDINGRQLTNIGVFRIYVQHYLAKQKLISKIDPIIVKQLSVTTQGMPLEISCFVNVTTNQDYEAIQADIFDHLLTACRKFDLEIMQAITLSDLHHSNSIKS